MAHYTIEPDGTLTKVVLEGGETAIVLPSTPIPVLSIGRGVFNSDVPVKKIVLNNECTTIKTGAFFGNSSLEWLTLGIGCNEIQKNAFQYSKTVQTIEVAEGNAAYMAVDGMLLSADGKTLVLGVDRKELVIPSSVEEIGYSAFACCKHITSLLFPMAEGFLRIGDYAFCDCRRITDIVIPPSVEYVGEGAFFGCEDCKGIAVYNDEILPMVFAACNDVSIVVLYAEHMKSICGVIGEESFSGDKIDSLYGRELPNPPENPTVFYPLSTNVYQLGNTMFKVSFKVGTQIQTSIDVSYGQPYGELPEVSQEGQTFLGWFIDGKKITAEMLFLYDSNKEAIAKMDTEQCTVRFFVNGEVWETDTVDYGTVISLVEKIPSGMDDFEGWYKAGDPSRILESITVVEDIDLYAKGALDELFNYYYVDGTGETEVGVAGFKQGIDLGSISASIAIPSDITLYGRLRKVTKIYSGAFANIEYSGEGKTFELPESIKSIGGQAFLNATWLEDINIPSSLEEIGYQAFYGASTLSSPLNFSRCTKLTIEGEAFANCVSLDTLKFVDYDVSTYLQCGPCEIGGGAFSGCTNLGSSDNRTLTIPALISMGYEAFKNTKFVFLDITGGVIGIAAFRECATISGIWLDVDVIEDQSFYGCSNLGNCLGGHEEIWNLDRLIHLGQAAFDGCPILEQTWATDKTVKWTDVDRRVVFIYDWIVDHVWNWRDSVLDLSSGTLDRIKGISKGAFSGEEEMYLLTTVKLPETRAYTDYPCVSICEGAFSECTGLNRVEISGSQAYYGWNRGSAPRLEKDCFRNCEALGQGGGAIIVYENGASGGEFIWRDVFVTDLTHTDPSTGVVSHVADLGYNMGPVTGEKPFTLTLNGSTTSPSNYSNAEFYGLDYVYSNVNNLASVGLTITSSVGRQTFYNCSSLTGTLKIENPNDTATAGERASIVIGEEAFAGTGFSEIALSGGSGMLWPNVIFREKAFVNCEALLSLPTIDAQSTTAQTDSIIRLVSNNVFEDCNNIPIDYRRFSGCEFKCSGIFALQITSGEFTGIIEDDLHEQYILSIAEDIEYLGASITYMGSSPLRCGVLYNIGSLRNLNVDESSGMVGKNVWSENSPMFAPNLTLKLFANSTKWSGPEWDLYSRKISEYGWLNPYTIVIPSIEGWLTPQTEFTKLMDNPFCGSNGYLMLRGQGYDNYLRNLNIPQTITRVPAFSCAFLKLDSITIPESVESIGRDAFYGCSENVFSSRSDGLVVIDGWIVGTNQNVGTEYDFSAAQDIVGIADYAFSRVPEPIYISGIRSGIKRTEESLENTVGVAGYGAYRLSMITSEIEPYGVCTDMATQYDFPPPYSTITIHNEIQKLYISAINSFQSRGIPQVMQIESDTTIIGAYAIDSILSESEFELRINSAHIYIEEYALRRTTWTITLNGIVESIAEYAFSGCTGLTNITLSSRMTQIPIGAFSETGLTSISLPDTLAFIGDEAFYNSRLEEIAIPDSVSSIGDLCFSGCTNLSSVILPENEQFEELGVELFSETGIQNIAIPSNVTYVYGYCFSGCTSLAMVTIASGSKPLGLDEAAFSGCSSLVNITIPERITYIGSRCFESCPNLEVVEFKGAPPETHSNDVFDGSPDVVIYSTHPGWEGITTWQNRSVQHETPPSMD